MAKHFITQPLQGCLPGGWGLGGGGREFGGRVCWADITIDLEGLAKIIGQHLWNGGILVEETVEEDVKRVANTQMD